MISPSCMDRIQRLAESVKLLCVNTHRLNRIRFKFHPNEIMLQINVETRTSGTCTLPSLIK